MKTVTPVLLICAVYFTLYILAVYNNLQITYYTNCIFNAINIISLMCVRNQAHGSYTFSKVKFKHFLSILKVHFQAFPAPYRFGKLCIYIFTMQYNPIQLFSLTVYFYDNFYYTIIEVLIKYV